MEKTILKLYANGDFETVDATLTLNQPYHFSENEIRIPNLIKLPSYKNYFIKKTVVPGYLGESDGLIKGSVEYDRTSDFIVVSKDENIVIRASYNGIVNSRPWVACCLYNQNKQYVSTAFAGHALPGGLTQGVYTNNFTIPNGVSYLRFCSNLVGNTNLDIKISIEKNTVPSVIHQNAIEDLNLPAWVVDTGFPISINEQGIVIKGEIKGRV